MIVSGCAGAGKSTFGMSVALNEGILRCMSTDSVRQVMRTYDNSPALQRSSYSGDGDTVTQWLECCKVLEDSVESLIMDSLNRGVSLVMEGVHIVPSNKIIDMWKSGGGAALGCVLVVKDEAKHKELILNRGVLTGKGAEGQVKAFNRIRQIQDEMVKRAEEHDWYRIELTIQRDPVQIIEELLDLQC